LNVESKARAQRREEDRKQKRLRKLKAREERQRVKAGQRAKESDKS
jgi:hypothetical protein